MSLVNLTKNVTILDATLRDSSYAIHFQFSARDTYNICVGLERSGISMIEVGHGMGLGASSISHGISLESDEDYLLAAKSALKKAKFGAFFIPEIGAKEDLKKAASLGMNFVRIGYDATDIGKTRSYVDYAKELGLEISLNPMKSYVLSVADFGVLASEVGKWGGVDTLCVVDSAGCMLPDAVYDYVKVASENCSLQLGFHGHNNLGLANANCLSAIKAGASFVDGTLRGMGRSAGNAQTEILAHVIAESGYNTGVDTVSLFNVFGEFLEPLMIQQQGIPSMEVLYGITKFHSSYLPKFRKISSKYNIDLKRLIMEVSRVNCINPADDLIENCAHDLSRTVE